MDSELCHDIVKWKTDRQALSTLNTSMTKEMIINFGWRPSFLPAVRNGERLLTLINIWVRVSISTVNWTGQSRLGPV